MIARVVSGTAAVRLAAAEDFIAALPADAEVLLVGAGRGAVDDLARRLAVRRRATLGLHRFTLTQLASRLAAPALSATGAAPCTALAAQAVAARAVVETRAAGQLRFFEPVAAAPGFTRSLAATLAELRAAGLAPDALAAAPAPADEIAALLAAYETHLDAARLADRAALLRAATAALTGPDRDPLVGLPLLLLDVPLTSRVEIELAHALAAAAAPVLVTIPDGDEAERHWAAVASNAPHDTSADPSPAPAAATPQTSLARLQAHLFADDEPPPAAPDGTVQIFSAPGEGREAVEIARRILALARGGTRFDEIAIVLRAPETYGALLEAALRRASIPAWFARGTRRPNPTGRAFLALLACAAENLSAARFAEYLSLGELPRPGAAPAWQPPHDELLAGGSALPDPAAGAAADDDADDAEPIAAAPWRWEALLTEAAVLGGADRWQRRLTGLANEYDARLERLRAGEPDDPQITALERTRAQLDVLRSFALPLIRRLADLPREAPWGVWLDALKELAVQALRAPASVHAVLAELAPMGPVGPVGLDEVRDILADRLATLPTDPPADRYGRVLVTTVDDLRGRALPVVFVPGLAERLFPQRPREDPLLLDALRAPLAAGLATQAERGARERLYLRLAAGAATRQLVLSYPRADVTQGRPRVISFYGLDVARATRGAIPDVEAFEREAADAANARLAWPAPVDPADAIDAAEHDLATLAALLHAERPPRAGAQYLLELNAHLGRSLRTRHARWEKRHWHELDGFTRASAAAAPLLAARRLTARPYSPSALEQFARCPYRFYLAAILRLAPRDEKAPLEQLDPLTRGTLVHRVQAETLRALLAGGTPLDATRQAEAERVLHDTLERVAAALAEEFAPPIARVWRDEIEALRGDLRTWLGRLLDRGTEWQPAYVELGIGLQRDDDHDPHSVRAPARVGDAGYLLRGAIDLVERHANGTLRVIDHKTGRDDVPAGLVVGKGERLQPALYALAVEAALGAPVQDARLSFCTTRGHFAEHVVRCDAHTRAAALDVLAVIDRAIAGGQFHAAPRADACATCAFRPVCGPYEEERVTRKDPIPDLAALRSRP